MEQKRRIYDIDFFYLCSVLLKRKPTYDQMSKIKEERNHNELLRVRKSAPSFS